MRSFFVAAMIAMTALASAQEKKPERRVTPAEAGTKAPNNDPKALLFLQRVEEKNKGLKAVHATFTQARKDHLFDETVNFEGEFWYTAKPSRFRAKYTGENSSDVWLTEEKYIEYIPGQKQVDMFSITKSQEPPVSQLLLGFGVKVDKITELFDVTSTEAAKDGETAIEFASRDLDRTMNFHKVTVHFDEAKAEPRRIVLEDDQNEITLAFKDVDLNASIDEKVFVPTWPDDGSVEVNDDASRGRR